MCLCASVQVCEMFRLQDVPFARTTQSSILFDFESKIKPRVPYHRDHPPKKHELWRSYQWVWFFSLAADYLINKRSEMFTWDSRCADFVGWEQWNRKSHSQWYSTPSDTPIEKKMINIQSEITTTFSPRRVFNDVKVRPGTEI